MDLDPDRIDFDDTYEEGRKLMWELNRSITVSGVERDTKAILDWMEAYAGALNGPAGAYGYCLGGRLALTAAASLPNRIAAAASFHGGGFVQDDTSRLADITAEIYFAHAGTDKYIPLDKIERLDAECGAAGLRRRFEIYNDAHHGFSIPGRRVYHQPSADRAWQRLFALFRRNLVQGAVGDQPRRIPQGITRV